MSAPAFVDTSTFSAEMEIFICQPQILSHVYVSQKLSNNTCMGLQNIHIKSTSGVGQVLQFEDFYFFLHTQSTNIISVDTARKHKKSSFYTKLLASFNRNSLILLFFTCSVLVAFFSNRDLFLQASAEKVACCVSVYQLPRYWRKGTSPYCLHSRRLLLSRMLLSIAGIVGMTKIPNFSIISFKEFPLQRWK